MRLIISSVVLTIAAFETPDNRVGDADDMSKEVKHTINVKAAGPSGAPQVVSIQRLRPGSQSVVSAFQEAIIPAEAFNVRIVLTEPLTGDLAVPADRLAVTNGVPSSIVVGTPFTRLGPTLVGSESPRVLPVTDLARR